MNSEALRLAALDALGPDGDPRAREVLEDAHVTVHTDATTWEGSDGTVHAHAVVLDVDAHAIGLLHAVPALGDALSAALSAAIAQSPLQSLHSISIRWNGQADDEFVGEHGYRGSVREPWNTPSTLRAGLQAWLRAQGHHALARNLEGARVQIDEGRLTVYPLDAAFPWLDRTQVETLLRDAATELLRGLQPHAEWYTALVLRR